MPDTIHVSVAWPYANGDLHVGHLAGAYLPADIFARYHRLKGNRVLMVSGSDSHGTPISVEADKYGITPRELFERFHKRFLTTQRDVGISYDLFTHTDTENHHQIARDIFTLLLERGYLYREIQQQLYSESQHRFLPDRLVEGTCYVCGFTDARGDQCDNCGTLMDATKLINPRSKIDGSTPVVRETEHYFLNLPAFTEVLQVYLDRAEKAGHWRDNVISFSRNYVANLQARAITRDLDWGIDVPLEGWEDKRLYVWFEAVMGYLTASIEWARNTGQPDAWKDWWYNPEAKIYNFIGKDNIPFHTVIWPAELTGISSIYNEGSDQPISLPYDVPANEFMNIEGRQFSKSRNWAIWLPDILERYQPDAIRYYVAMTFPESRDSDFAWDGFFNRVNNELVAAWGNLVNRMLGFSAKRFDGCVPIPGDLTEDDKQILALSVATLTSVGDMLAAVKLRSALQEAMRVVQEANAYLDRRAPWKLIKTDPQDAATVVYTILRVIDNLKIALAPFLPFTAQQLHEMLGYEGNLFGVQQIATYQEATRPHDALIYDASQASGRWEPSELPPGQQLGEITPLFVKLDDTIIDEERARLGAPRPLQTTVNCLPGIRACAWMPPGHPTARSRPNVSASPRPRQYNIVKSICAFCPNPVVEDHCMLRSLLLYLSNASWAKAIITHFFVARRVVRRFVAGETLAEGIEAVRKLNQAGLLVTFDILGESVHSEEDAAQATQQYLTLLDTIAGQQLEATVSLKLTQLGLDISEETCVANLRRILEKARDIQNHVTIDMESSDYTDVTLRVFRASRQDYGFANVGTVIQASLRRSAQDMAELHAEGAFVRLCKGAYKEPPERAFPVKADVDANYVRLMQAYLTDDSGAYLGIATHDAKIIETARAFIQAEAIPHDRFEFQMLYGIRSDLQRELARSGYKMRVYVPFGSQWYPYFMRRLAERPANLWFFVSNLFRG